MRQGQRTHFCETILRVHQKDASLQRLCDPLKGEVVQNPVLFLECIVTSQNLGRIINSFL